MAKKSGDSDKNAPPPLPPSLPRPAFDAHCHIDAMAYRSKLTPSPDFVRSVMEQARRVGVNSVITVGDTMASSRWCAQTAIENKDIFAAVAVHPTEVAGMSEADYDELAVLAADPNVVAIGETGLDYYWDRTTPAQQQEHFRRHIDLAKGVGKTLMIHDREAHEDILAILDAEGAPDRVVFHAFSGDPFFAKACIERGFFLSFPGVVTFTNAPDLRAAAAVTSIDHILVETDAPFLTPHPYRGRPNAPYLVPHMVLALAEALSVTVERMCEAITSNGSRAFGVDLTSI